MLYYRGTQKNSSTDLTIIDGAARPILGAAIVRVGDTIAVRCHDHHSIIRGRLTDCGPPAIDDACVHVWRNDLIVIPAFAGMTAQVEGIKAGAI